MVPSPLSELEQLHRLHDLLTVRLELLARRGCLAPDEVQQQGHLECRRLQVAARIAWLERRHRPAANISESEEQTTRKSRAQSR
jgi:hypothetical protein